MRNVIVVAYQLHYSKGSECAVAWDYIRHMSQNNRLTVLYGSSGGHHEIGNTAAMEEYTALHPIENVTFVSVKPSFLSKYWGYSLSGIRKFYKEYKLWHDDVYNLIRELISKEKYDIIHFLGPIGYHEPGRLYQLPLPYIWGPVGGMGLFPARMLVNSDLRYGFSGGGTRFVIKALLSYWRLNTNRRVKRAFREADVVVGATTEYVRNIERAIGKRHHSVIKYLPENCINEVFDLNYDKFEAKRIKLIFIGRLDGGKAPMIVLEALAKMGDDAKRLHVDFLGDGPLKERCENYVRERGLGDVVTIHGHVGRSEVLTMISYAQLMVLTSLYDANTTVVWEAMAHAVPTMCLDHCGMRDTIKDGSGIRIPLGSWNEVVDRVAAQLRKIVCKPDILKVMAEKLLEDRMDYTWEKRHIKFEELYKLAEKQHDERKH